MYVTDWLATLLTVAGLGSLLPAGTDSLNMWPSLSWGRESPRDEIVLNLDQVNFGQLPRLSLTHPHVQDTWWGTWSAAIIAGKYKLIWGQHKLLKTNLSII